MDEVKSDKGTVAKVDVTPVTSKIQSQPSEESDEEMKNSEISYFNKSRIGFSRSFLQIF